MKTVETCGEPARSEASPKQVRQCLWVSSKVTERHLDCLSIVYVRQSSAKQVTENRESTEMQYGLRERAVALGWSDARVVVIDDDLGQSGQSVHGRPGFQRLLAEVGLDHVGLVLGLEMSRLARSCRDWHQLLELCAVFGTLLGDADGIYDPRDYNDRLLLGLKGTMSEAELHVLRGRLQAGQRNKAQRGELFSHAAIGYIRSRTTGLEIEPDEQARAVVQLIFDKFTELGSATAVLQYLTDHRILVGVRPHRGPERDQLVWRRPNRATLLGMLHHPLYAGAYAGQSHLNTSTLFRWGLILTSWTRKIPHEVARFMEEIHVQEPQTTPVCFHPGPFCRSRRPACDAHATASADRHYRHRHLWRDLRGGILGRN